MIKFQIVRHDSAKPNGRRWNAMLDVCCSITSGLFWIKSCLEAPVTSAEEGSVSSAGSSLESQLLKSLLQIPVSNWDCHLLEGLIKTQGHPAKPDRFARASLMQRNFRLASHLTTRLGVAEEWGQSWQNRAICWSDSDQKKEQVIMVSPGQGS